MTLKEVLTNYNSKIGNLVPKIESANVVDLCSITDVIDNSREFSFKVSLFPPDLFEQLLDFSDTTFEQDLTTLEYSLSDKMRQIAFYPKQNITFEKTMHVPILNLDAMDLSENVESVYQIPIQVNYYMLFNDTINTIKRYYNSNLVFDHTAYMAIPECIVNEYDFDDLFYWVGGSGVPYTDSSIQDYGIDFTNMNNFKFIIDDADILAQTKNIVFMEIVLASNIKNFDFYIIMKSGDDIYLRKGNPNRLKYRKLYYNVDFINIKNRLVKYST